MVKQFDKTQPMAIKMLAKFLCCQTLFICGLLGAFNLEANPTEDKGSKPKTEAKLLNQPLDVISNQSKLGLSKVTAELSKEESNKSTLSKDLESSTTALENVNDALQQAKSQLEVFQTELERVKSNLEQTKVRLAKIKETDKPISLQEVQKISREVKIWTDKINENATKSEGILALHQSLTQQLKDLEAEKEAIESGESEKNEEPIYISIVINTKTTKKYTGTDVVAELAKAKAFESALEEANDADDLEIFKEPEEYKENAQQIIKKVSELKNKIAKIKRVDLVRALREMSVVEEELKSILAKATPLKNPLKEAVEKLVQLEKEMKSLEELSDDCTKKMSKEGPEVTKMSLNVKTLEAQCEKNRIQKDDLAKKLSTSLSKLSDLVEKKEHFTDLIRKSELEVRRLAEESALSSAAEASMEHAKEKAKVSFYQSGVQQGQKFANHELNLKRRVHTYDSIMNTQAVDQTESHFLNGKRDGISQVKTYLLNINGPDFAAEYFKARSLEKPESTQVIVLNRAEAIVRGAKDGRSILTPQDLVRKGPLAERPVFQSTRNDYTDAVNPIKDASAFEKPSSYSLDESTLKILEKKFFKSKSYSQDQSLESLYQSHWQGIFTTKTAELFTGDYPRQSEVMYKNGFTKGVESTKLDSPLDDEVKKVALYQKGLQVALDPLNPDLNKILDETHLAYNESLEKKSVVIVEDVTAEGLHTGYQKFIAGQASQIAYALAGEDLAVSVTLRNLSNEVIPAGALGLQFSATGSFAHSEEDLMKLPDLPPRSRVVFKNAFITRPKIPDGRTSAEHQPEGRSQPDVFGFGLKLYSLTSSDAKSDEKVDAAADKRLLVDRSFRYDVDHTLESNGIFASSLSFSEFEAEKGRSFLYIPVRKEFLAEGRARFQESVDPKNFRIYPLHSLETFFSNESVWVERDQTLLLKIPYQESIRTGGGSYYGRFLVEWREGNLQNLEQAYHSGGLELIPLNLKAYQRNVSIEINPMIGQEGIDGDPQNMASENCKDDNQLIVPDVRILTEGGNNVLDAKVCFRVHKDIDPAEIGLEQRFELRPLTTSWGVTPPLSASSSEFTSMYNSNCILTPNLEFVEQNVNGVMQRYIPQRTEELLAEMGRSFPKTAGETYSCSISVNLANYIPTLTAAADSPSGQTHLRDPYLSFGLFHIKGSEETLVQEIILPLWAHKEAEAIKSQAD